jgi:hypothetical protein
MEYGFYTDIESDTIPIGLSEEVMSISAKKERNQMDARLALSRTGTSFKWKSQNGT